MVAGFFDSIAGVSHRVIDSWCVDGKLTCHGTVSYTRHDGSVLTVPFANIMTLRQGSGRASEYLIFADTSELYA